MGAKCILLKIRGCQGCQGTHPLLFDTLQNILWKIFKLRFYVRGNKSFFWLFQELTNIITGFILFGKSESATNWFNGINGATKAARTSNKRCQDSKCIRQTHHRRQSNNWIGRKPTWYSEQSNQNLTLKHFNLHRIYITFSWIFFVFWLDFDFWDQQRLGYSLVVVKWYFNSK